MASKIARGSATSVLLLLGACSGLAREPYFSSADTAPIATDRARIYFFRELEPYESLARPWMYIDGRPVLISEPGGVSFRDVSPGSHQIAVFSPGIYPNQFKRVVLQPGDTLYVRTESLRNWYRGFNWEQDTFVVALIDESDARTEMAKLRYVPDDSEQ
jgi:hypothetical protein